MFVRATEIKNNFGKYLEIASEQEIIITRNGASVAKLISVKNQSDKSISEQLRGILPNNINEESIKEARMMRH